jgi:uncharacterized delta-60 repeat protein
MKNVISQSIVKFSILFTIILFSLSSAYAAGAFDRTFGTNGVVTTRIGNSAGAATAVLQPDGKIVVVGSYYIESSSDFNPVIVRYSSDGSLDASFGEGGIVRTPISTGNDYFGAVALQSDGKIVAVGGTRPPQTEYDNFLAVRYNQNGTLDSSFGTNGIVTMNRGGSGSVAVQSDGKIVAAAGNSVFRLNAADGSVDTSFADNGFLSYNYDLSCSDCSIFLGAGSRKVLVLPNGRILVGWSVYRKTNIQNYYRNASVLMLLESNGTFAQNFGNNGIAAYNYGVSDFNAYNFDLAILPNGKILTISLQNALFSDKGVVTPIYPRSAPFTLNSAVAVRSDGKYITLNGNYISREKGTDLYSPDNRSIGGARLMGNDIILQPDNKLIVVGSTQTEFKITRLTAITSQATRIADYDDDDATDIAVLRASNLTLYVLRSSGGYINYAAPEPNFQMRRVIPEYKNSFVYWGNNVGGSDSPAFFCYTNETRYRECRQWGLLGDVSVGGDYDGDGVTDRAVFRPEDGSWYFSPSTVYPYELRSVQWGTSGDKPVPADYDYDGITDIAIYRPSTGTWWIRRSSDNTYFSVQFGISSDTPLTGDYDGDGRADFVVYRPSDGFWYQLLTTDGFRAIKFGISTDIPVPGDYDGDGRHDLAVFRQGIWYLLQSTAGFKAIQFGLADDVPVSVRYDK